MIKGNGKSVYVFKLPPSLQFIGITTSIDGEFLLSHIVFLRARNQTIFWHLETESYTVVKKWENSQIICPSYVALLRSTE